MATFNYYLRNTKSIKTTPIILFIASNNSVTKISTRESIEPKYWDSKKQRVKKSYTGSPELNQFLSSYLLKAQSVYRNFISENVNPSSSELRNAIELPKAKSNSEFKIAYQSYLQANTERLQANTLKKYRTLYQHLLTYQEKSKKNLTFSGIDLEFYDSFKSFLAKNLEHTNNTISKYLKTLKSFMNWSLEREFHNNLTFKKFKSTEFEVDIIYLNYSEVLKLLNLDLSNSRTLERVCDAFCFGCFTGQRFSDIYNLTWDDIRNDSWFLHTKKTQDFIEIPLNDFALSILKKYKGKQKPIEPYSNQKMNDHLKDLGKLAGISEIQKKITYSGNKRIELSEPKYNFITTHTARRTFVTLSLEKGMRPETLMEITGHKDYKTLKRYIKITSKVKEIEMKKIWNSA